MSEVAEGAIGGASNGLATGMMTGNPYAAVGGAILGGISGAIGGNSKKKARKKAEKRLREALAKLMAGSVDAYGNTLSADGSGRWQYNLSNAGKNAKSIAERELLAARNYQNKTPQQIAQDNALIQALSDAQMNKIARSAVSRSGLRTGSNMSNALGNIARQSANNLRNSWINGISSGKNAQQYNLNMRNTLNTGAYNAMKSLNSMQSNLQNMVRGLNLPTAQLSIGVANSINNLQNDHSALNGADSNILSALKNYNQSKNLPTIGQYQLFDMR